MHEIVQRAATASSCSEHEVAYLMRTAKVTRQKALEAIREAGPDRRTIFKKVSARARGLDTGTANRFGGPDAELLDATESRAGDFSSAPRARTQTGKRYSASATRRPRLLVHIELLF